MNSRRQRWLALAATAVSFLLFVALGEVVLRIIFFDGASFSNIQGPMTRRFMRDFRYNRYDGPSRGPELTGGAARVLVQGDSITFGAGVRGEDNLYTSRLLAELRARGVDADMAVLAQGGRDIDGHFEQLEKWGPQIAPDLVIYQWSVNDVELSKGSRPKALHLLPRFLHGPLYQHSYFYFFVDQQLNVLASPYVNGRSYEQYWTEDYREGSAAWQSFVDRYQQWCASAHRLSPRVIVLLYPHLAAGRGAPVKFSEVGMDLASRTRKLCDAVYVEPRQRFAAVADGADLVASRFDGHPSVLGHRLLSDALLEAIEQQWPELFAAAPASTAGAPAP
ncbi:MAG: SGNH/GDSL hydrolase family protein [Gammaproteobacteria bacterium]|nr:MAG: SGNH/GDSL hydrolase family protein [Gammaproteobacteria bacterium]